MFVLNLKTLVEVSRIINKENYLWCIGGSFLLHYHNLVDKVRDIDILANEEEGLSLHNLLLPLGEYLPLPPKEPYLTKYFFHHKIRDTEIDIIGGFSIKHNQGIYDFILDGDSISTHRCIEGIKIPLSNLEDWYILYQLIPGREDKVNLIEKHFLKNGIEKPQILQKALTRELPYIVRKRIERLISCTD